MSLYDKLQSVILAAGKSTRFDSNTTKLAEKICGRPMILYCAKLFEELNIDSTFVVGHQKELIQEIVSSNIKSKVSFVHQIEQLGTGHAVACTKELWEKENIVIINGDGPLINKQIIEALYKKHLESNSAISFVVAKCPYDHAYGRVIKNEYGIKIIEAKDFDSNKYPEEYDINAGIYIANTDFLRNCIDKIGTQNAKGEFYLTDLVQIASDAKLSVITHLAPFEIVMGINTNYELMQTEEIKRAEIIKYWASKGVKFSSISGINIDIDVEIGHGTIIEYGTQITSGSKIGKHCTIKRFSTIENSTLGDFVTIHQNSLVRDSYVLQNTKVGPFAHVRADSTIDSNCLIGNFVEIKSCQVGKNTNVLHLSYLGDTATGSFVNIGAGTITCNYDGFTKHPTNIQDNVFIGSNNTLVAPVTIGQNSFTAAGSTITEDVPSNSLAIGRTKQVNKQDYVNCLMEKLRVKSENQKFQNSHCKDEADNNKEQENNSNENNFFGKTIEKNQDYI